MDYIQLRGYGSISYGLYQYMQKKGMTEKQIIGILQIWDYLSRVAYITAEDYRGDIRQLKVNDIKLAFFKTVTNKEKRTKEITMVYDLPYRTKLFFETKYTDIKRAYKFFNAHNKENGIKWLMEEHLLKIPKFALSDFVAPGLMVHTDALAKYRWADKNEHKREF